MRPGEQQYVDRLVERCQSLVPAGETVRTAWTAVRGLGSSRLMLLSWFTQILVVFRTFRVIAVTDSTVHVFKSGWFTRYKPGQLLFSLPLNGAVQITGSGGRFQVGSEKLKVDRPFLAPLVEAIQAPPDS